MKSGNINQPKKTPRSPSGSGLTFFSQHPTPKPTEADRIATNVAKQSSGFNNKS